jgi:zinc protease
MIVLLRLSALCLALFLIVPAQANSGRIAIEQFTLKNGMHVILHQDNSTPVVAINVMYHVGSKNEQPDRTGFAHFFEHLMFEGTNNIPRGEFFKIVQNAGGRNNAGTSFDYTTYYEVLPSNQLALGLWLESERMLHLQIDSIGVETQRKVIKEERKARYENQPYGSFQEKIFSNVFEKHPYRWVPIGDVQYIDEATLPEFIEFYKHFYVPNNAVLVIAGDFDPKQAKKLVKQYFETIPRGIHQVYRPNLQEVPREQEVREIVYDNIQLPAVFFAYRIPAMGTEDYYALDMLQNLLSVGQSSRLYKSLVDNQQKAIQVAAFPFALEDAGVFISLALANLGIDPDAVEAAMNEEIEKIKTGEIGEQEFQKLKNQVESSFYTRNATMEGIAMSLANYHLFLGDAGLINTEISRYERVSPEDIQRVARQYLTPENRVVLHYLPKLQEK